MLFVQTICTLFFLFFLNQINYFPSFQSIEFFLAKTVTHFVTDKPIDRDGNLLNVSTHYLSPSPLLLAKTPSPAPKQPSSIQSLHDLNNSDDKQAACSRPKSRADAMVQRARITPQPVSPLESKSLQCAATQSILPSNPNPMQLAQHWGTQIWNTEHTLKFLDKVALALKLDHQTRTTSSTKSSHHHHHHHHKTANVKHLNGDYIKIESTQKVSFFPLRIDMKAASNVLRKLDNQMEKMQSLDDTNDDCSIFLSHQIALSPVLSGV